MPAFRKAAEILADIPRDKKRCYVLMAYGDETPAQAQARAKEVFDLGFLPFAQLYQDEKGRQYGKEWQKVMRSWSRPAAMKSKKKDEGMPLFEAAGF